MKIVYVIGAGSPKIIELIKNEMADKGFKPVFVDSEADIPVADRLDSQIRKEIVYTMKPLPEIEPIPFVENNRKGHKRPYKYHK